MKPSESSLKQACEAARQLATEGKLDSGRLLRAFQLLEELIEDKQAATIEGYKTTANSCNCPDSIERLITCKHQIAIGILEIAKELDQEAGALR